TKPAQKKESSPRPTQQRRSRNTRTTKQGAPRKRQYNKRPDSRDNRADNRSDNRQDSSTNKGAQSAGNKSDTERNQKTTPDNSAVDIFNSGSSAAQSEDTQAIHKTNTSSGTDTQNTVQANTDADSSQPPVQQQSFQQGNTEAGKTSMSPRSSRRGKRGGRRRRREGPSTKSDNTAPQENNVENSTPELKLESDRPQPSESNPTSNAPAKSTEQLGNVSQAANVNSEKSQAAVNGNVAPADSLSQNQGNSAAITNEIKKSTTSIENANADSNQKPSSNNRTARDISKNSPQGTFKANEEPKPSVDSSLSARAEGSSSTRAEGSSSTRAEGSSSTRAEGSIRTNPEGSSSTPAVIASGDGKNQVNVENNEHIKTTKARKDEESETRPVESKNVVNINNGADTSGSSSTNGSTNRTPQTPETETKAAAKAKVSRQSPQRQDRQQDTREKPPVSKPSESPTPGAANDGNVDTKKGNQSNTDNQNRMTNEGSNNQTSSIENDAENK
ncbi:MAG: hypothetical protein ACC707_14150, partial [Thiohalomonadales bacterium]